MESISRANLSDSFLRLEREKSNLLLGANLLKAQGRYEEAAERFGRAAILESRLVDDLYKQNKLRKAFIHEFSVLSCWAQAGNLYQALQVGTALLQRESLSAAQRAQTESYLNKLRSRMMQWMVAWEQESVSAD